MFKRFCVLNLPTVSNYKNNMKIHLQNNFITYFGASQIDCTMYLFY